MEKYYGVSQSYHGHEYYYVFTKSGIERYVKPFESAEEINGMYEFPVGGSNSSVAFIKELNGDEEVVSFLKETGLGPDFEDPCLVDLAEYSKSIDTDDECWSSCTKIFLDKYNINPEEYEFTDCRYDEAAAMIEELRKAGYEDFDYSDPFYGENRDMTYDELCELYEEVCLNREGK